MVAVAITIFTVAGWSRIGPLGRCAILLAVTAGVLAAAAAACPPQPARDRRGGRSDRPRADDRRCLPDPSLHRAADRAADGGRALRRGRGGVGRLRDGDPAQGTTSGRDRPRPARRAARVRRACGSARRSRPRPMAGTAAGLIVTAAGDIVLAARLSGRGRPEPEETIPRTGTPTAGWQRSPQSSPGSAAYSRRSSGWLPRSPRRAHSPAFRGATRHGWRSSSRQRRSSASADPPAALR